MDSDHKYDLRKVGIQQRFWFRVLLDLFWLFILIVFASIFIVSNDPYGYSWIVIIILSGWFVIESKSSWKKEKYLLTLLELDQKSNSVHIIINKYDECYLDQSYPLPSLSVELKELRLGRLFVPSYMIVLHHNKETILKQRSNLVWKRDDIRDMSIRLKGIIENKM